MRIISQLSEPHMKLIQLAVDAPFCQGTFHGEKVITFSRMFTEDGRPSVGVLPILIMPHFPEADQPIVKLLCMELVGKGLLRDEGVNRIGVDSMTYFVATDAARILIETIKG